MRVVVVHNRYRSANPSGENRVAESDIEQLRADGVEVIPYIRDSDEIENFTALGKAGLAVRPVVSPVDSLAFRRLLREVQPHIVHLHNPFPLISPWIARTAKAQRVPVVQTVHNYRHVCVNGIHFRDGQMCTECVGKKVPWPAVKHGCYQGSRARSVPMAAALMAHRGTWDLVDRFLPVGDAVAEHLRAIGIEERQIEVRPNVVDDPGPPAPLGQGVLFAGRLSPEKGVNVLLEAWRTSRLGNEHTLSIAGDGELRPEIEAASAADSSIRYLGILDRESLNEAYRSSAAAVVPSLWPEPDPIAVITALSHGRPVVGTALGSIPTSISGDCGWIVSDTSSTELATVLKSVLADPAECERRGRAARERFECSRSAASGISLLSVYERLTSVPRGSLLIAGPDGAGKTAVADEIARRAESVDVVVARAHFRPGLISRMSQVSGAPVTEPQAQIPRSHTSALLRSCVVWVDFLAGWLGPWRRAARRGLLLVERPWLDQVVDPVRYRLPASVVRSIVASARLLPRPDRGVLLTGDAQAIHARKPEIGQDEVARQLRRWSELAPLAAHRATTTKSVGVPISVTVDEIIENATPSASIETKRTWVRPLGFPKRVEMCVTIAPPAASALSIYPPQRRTAAIASRVGTTAMRAGLHRRATPPPPPVERISASLGLAADGFAAMRSSSEGRWVIGAQCSGRLAWVLKAGPETDDGLTNEAEFLAMLANATTEWRVPRLLVSCDTEGWRVVATEAVAPHQPRPGIEEVVDITNDLVSGRATGSPVIHGDLAPWNLLRDHAGQLVVLDWEAAAKSQRPLWDLTHYITQQGILLGTPDVATAADLLTRTGSPGLAHLETLGEPADGAKALVGRYLSESSLPRNVGASGYRAELRKLLT